ncbi:MAG TPA: Gfo/Idh/MocA family oxidoreductase [Ktedonobacterales bacterium]|nr:Gfo/Idh/MocA family oxidoreductase [Ktedonobacterales bacterium]
MLDPQEELLAVDDTPVRWGIIGPGWIARGAIMPAFASIAIGDVVAVASRDRARANAFATDFNIPRAYAGYDLLVDDPDVEAIYIALPNNLHAEWAIRAMQAGKQVLCEKPLASTAREAEGMVAAAAETDSLFMEATMYRFHPRMREAVALVHSGAIGTPLLVRGSFCFTMANADNYRNHPEMGGGALLDVGSYCINAARWLLNEEPHTAMAMSVLADSGIDETVAGLLAFPSGALAQLQCSFGSAEHQNLDIVGTDGSIEVVHPFTAWRNDETAIRLTQGDQTDDIIFPPADHYAIMLEHFSACVRGQDEPWTPPEDGVGTLRAMDALRRSAASGRAERV